jgi:negative regulator of genetic competence, sporulation and motility
MICKKVDLDFKGTKSEKESVKKEFKSQNHALMYESEINIFEKVIRFIKNEDVNLMRLKRYSLDYKDYLFLACKDSKEKSLYLRYHTN